MKTFILTQNIVNPKFKKSLENYANLINAEIIYKGFNKLNTKDAEFGQSENTSIFFKNKKLNVNLGKNQINSSWAYILIKNNDDSITGRLIESGQNGRFFDNGYEIDDLIVRKADTSMYIEHGI